MAMACFYWWVYCSDNPAARLKLQLEVQGLYKFARTAQACINMHVQHTIVPYTHVALALTPASCAGHFPRILWHHHADGILGRASDANRSRVRRRLHVPALGAGGSLQRQPGRQAPRGEDLRRELHEEGRCRQGNCDRDVQATQPGACTSWYRVQWDLGPAASVGIYLGLVAVGAEAKRAQCTKLGAPSMCANRLLWIPRRLLQRTASSWDCARQKLDSQER